MSSSKSQSQKSSFVYGSPCAACKFLRRKCLPDCIFAPHFPADEPRKFEIVHQIYGASNLSKILNQLPHYQREDAVISLVYEAEARLNEPVHGCVRFISILQERLRELQIELLAARRELLTYTVSQTQAAHVPIQQPLYLPDEASSSSIPVVPPLRAGTRVQSLSEQLLQWQCPYGMTVDPRQLDLDLLLEMPLIENLEGWDTYYGWDISGNIQPHAVSQTSDVRLHEQQLQQQPFDSPQQPATAEQPPTTAQPQAE